MSTEHEQKEEGGVGKKGRRRKRHLSLAARAEYLIPLYTNITAVRKKTDVGFICRNVTCGEDTTARFSLTFSSFLFRAFLSWRALVRRCHSFADDNNKLHICIRPCERCRKLFTSSSSAQKRGMNATARNTRPVLFRSARTTEEKKEGKKRKENISRALSSFFSVAFPFSLFLFPVHFLHWGKTANSVAVFFLS